jgi:Glycosyl hydrolases family 38 N-terminal domain/Alpha mannosidase middle domain/Glycosyl hydrolases family 38 C-terminal domain
VPETRKLYLYLHTHWDREWYLTHEEYRSQLFFVIQDLLRKLELGELPSFFLDGQTCAIEDVEEIDPSIGESIRRLVQSGLLEIGPWYVLADEMLVGGESLIRNLEMGMDVARRYGQPAMIGYCPDTFGHSQDLPRILQSFGIGNCFVWRGVPELSPSNLFWWTSPDGSKVLVYHLSRGYFQALFHGQQTAEKLAEFLLSWLSATASQEEVAGAESASSSSMSRPFQSILIPVGGDHLAAPSGFERQLDAARLLLKIETVAQALDIQPIKEKGKALSKSALTVQSTTLTDFAEVMQNYAASKASVILEITGELRENAAALRYERAYVLPGVLSTRLYLKHLNRLAEKRLVRISEPIFTFLHCRQVMQYPHAPLKFAWRILLRNHPHDSICGCSIDAVHREMLSRFAQIDSILNVLERKAFEALAADRSGNKPVPASQALDFSPGGDTEYGVEQSVQPIVLPPPKLKAAAKKKVVDAYNYQPETRVQPIYNVDYALNAEAETNLPKSLAALGQPCLADPDFTRTNLILANLSTESAIGPIPISWTEHLPDHKGENQIAKQSEHLPESNSEDQSEKDSEHQSPNRPRAADVGVYCDDAGTTWQVASVSERLLVFTGTNHVPESKTVRVYNGWVWSDRVPSMGWCSFAWPDRSAWVSGPKLLRASHDDVSADDRRLANEFLTVEVAPDGSIVATVKDSRRRARVFKLGHHIRDLGDAGDSYNFDPMDGDRPLQARLTGVKLGAPGPLVASLLLTYELAIPEGMIEPRTVPIELAGDQEEKAKYSRSQKLLPHQFSTKIELHKSVPVLFFETSWENRSRNHRLEVVLDTGLTVQKTLSENHFSIVERTVTSKKSPLPVAAGTEAPLDRFPCQRFFVANRQVFFNSGLPEYGVDGSSVTITILRAVSHLSRDDLRSRGGGAGPPLTTDEANCLSLNQVNYGWAPLAGDVGHETGELASAPPESSQQPSSSEPAAVLANFAKISAQQKEDGGENIEDTESSETAVFERLGSALPIGLTSWRSLDADVINAYRLAELYEGLSWSCLTADAGKVESQSFVQIDNPAVRVVALRTLKDDETAEIRLLNVLLTRQTAELHVQIPHLEAQMTTADGRILELLEKVEEIRSHPVEAKIEPIGQAKNSSRKGEDTDQVSGDMLGLIQSARYRIELGPNALISIRLKQNAVAPEKHQSKRKGGS